MTIPDYETLMLPVLRLASDRPLVSMREATSEMADRFNLTEEERATPIPSGGQSTISNRTHWAVTYMVKAGLLERPKRGHFTITERGRELLAQGPDRVDRTTLMEYPEFIEFRNRTNTPNQPKRQDTEQAASERASASGEDAEGTPEERIAAANEELNAELRSDLLDVLQNVSPTLFEHVIIDLMRAMNYGDARGGNSQHLGKTRDGGVDGVINEDPLGLDVVLLQAKRYATGSAIGVEKIREFAGTLDERGATKGVFVTTSHFTPEARNFADRIAKRIILIDAERLTSLMVRYGVGVRVIRTVDLKRVDSDYFMADG